MKRVRCIIFSSFFIENNGLLPNVEFLESLFRKQTYSEAIGFGFSQIRLEAKKIEAVLLKKNNTYVQEYDTERDELIKKQISVFSTLRFEIDTELNLLTAYGGSGQLSSLRSAFRSLPSLKFTSDPVFLDPEDFYSKLNSSEIDFKVQQLTVKNFNYQDGMIGRFSGEVSNQAIALELLQEYTSNVVKTTFQIAIDGQYVLVQLLPNGSIKLLCEEDDFDYYLNYLKQLIF